jgi:GNAT superfamily N-acetyltransferase
VSRKTSQAALRIEPLDTARHDRAGFASGVDQVDNFLRKTANKLAQSGNLRVFVLTDPDDRLIGYYALNAHVVDYQDLPSRYVRTRPGHGQIPAAFIAMIGVDARFQGQGYGADLLADALKRIWRAGRDLGIAVAMLDILDCGNPQQVERRRSLYERYGFAPLAMQPNRMFLPLATLDSLLAAH